MHITYEELLNMPEMKEGKLISGFNGLSRIITWYHINELKKAYEWINSGELVFLSGVGLEDVDKDLVKIVEGLNSKNAAGLVIQVGPYIKKVPEKVKEISNKLNIPIIQIPFELKIIDITYAISKKIFENNYEDKSMGEILKAIICLDYKEELKERAKFYGYNPDSLYLSVVLERDNNIQCKEYDENLLKSTIMNFVKNAFQKRRINILYLVDENYFVLLVPIKSSNNFKEYLCEIINEIKEKVKKEFEGVTISAGIGSYFSELKELKKSTIEAEHALEILRACNRKNDIRIYDEIGIYRLFFNLTEEEELESILKGVLGKLIEYDKETESDLVNTLEQYLINDRNIGKTAEALFIHRNTLKYRINRAQEILLCNFEDVNT